MVSSTESFQAFMAAEELLPVHMKGEGDEAFIRRFAYWIAIGLSGNAVPYLGVLAEIKEAEPYPDRKEMIQRVYQDCVKNDDLGEAISRYLSPLLDTLFADQLIDAIEKGLEDGHVKSTIDVEIFKLFTPEQ